MGAGKEPDATCRLKLEEEVGTRRDFVVACPNALAASIACEVTGWWFPPHFSVYAEFAIRRWRAEVPSPEAVHPIWPACWVDTPERSSSSVSKAALGVAAVDALPVGFRVKLGLVRSKYLFMRLRLRMFLSPPCALFVLLLGVLSGLARCLWPVRLLF